MIAMLTLMRCDASSVSALLQKTGTDRGSGDRMVEGAGPAPVAARRRIGNRFPPPPPFLHDNQHRRLTSLRHLTPNQLSEQRRVTPTVDRPPLRLRSVS